ncbi:DEAD/DEAH box helicase [Listeria booriae]|uniref:DEAD/DEAH box helicase n=1 Tax=Listeria booriae TaxID=1552123 RepID=A0A842AD95_9LIST|nr:DEAD/DEAH box helicase [Listeria booriae]MBC1615287.1 DEAD/DEAH box helicase [Listeria booriae]
MINFKTNALEHQTFAANKLERLKVGALLMDMGVGKTRTIFEIYERKRARGKVDKLVYICPFAVKTAIEDEITKHYVDKPDIIILGYETISMSDNTYLHLLSSITSKTMIVLDESHYIKNINAKRTERLLKCALNTPYRFIMTGTEITKHVDDLYSQFLFLDKRILGYNSFNAFARNHLEYSMYNPSLVTKSHNIEYLGSKIQPYVYQAKKEDCVSLPEQEYIKRNYYTSDEKEREYIRIKEYFLNQIEQSEDYSSVMIFQMFTQLQKICDTDPRKIENILAIFQEMSGLKIAYFKYISSLDMVKQGLINGFEYSGRIPVQQRKEVLRKWRKSENGILLLTYGTGSLSLNLQDASNVLFANKTFDYAQRVQAENRIHRIGQANNCTYVDLSTHTGIERYIDKSIDRKENLIESFTNQVEKIKNDTSMDQRKELRKLWEKRI